MALVLIRPLAQADLAETYAFIAEASEARAGAWLEKIDAQLQLLADMPEMGRRREELSAGLRSFPVGNHLVFYRPLADNDGIEVIRVLSGSRDIEGLFD